MFDGSTYDEGLDRVRLESQLGRVAALMRDGEWRTLAEIRRAVGGSTASLSARLRDLRKPKFGGYLVERRRMGDVGFLYRLRLVPGTQRRKAERFGPQAMQAALATERPKRRLLLRACQRIDLP